MLRRSALLLTAVLAIQGVPSSAGGPSVIRPVLATTSLALGDVLQPLAHERMIGVTWRTGHPQIRLRWHEPSGWSPWAVAEEDSTKSPEGIPGTEPQWRPPGADLVELSTTGTAQSLRLVRVSDGASHHLGFGAVAHATTGRAVLGLVHSRADWGADESLRRASPSYAARVEAVVVHHTANANGYQPSDVPALIRADYAYHVQARGWNDLGYNLLVDQYGGVWEGRAGGLGRATVGAHAEGFNTGTLGVAVIGDLTKTTVTHDAEKALARVIGYAALTWRFDPTGMVSLTSRGSERFAPGARASLHRVFGHLETSATECPGSLEGRLGYLRALAKVAMGPAPKITRATVTGAPLHAPNPVVVDASLSLPAAWKVQLSGPSSLGALGTTVTATGTGTAPHLAWDGLAGGMPGLPGTYTWAVSADDDFHDVVTKQGQFEVGLPLVG